MHVGRVSCHLHTQASSSAQHGHRIHIDRLAFGTRREEKKVEGIRFNPADEGALGSRDTRHAEEAPVPIRAREVRAKKFGECGLWAPRGLDLNMFLAKLGRLRASLATES